MLLESYKRGFRAPTNLQICQEFMGLGLQTLTTRCTTYPSWKEELYSTSKWLQCWSYVFNGQKILPLLALKQAFWKAEGEKSI